MSNTQKNKPQVIISYENYKGGVNNLKVVNVYEGYSLLKTFTGKTAEKRAIKFISSSN